MHRNYHPFYLAQSISEKNHEKLKKWDNQFAIFRLISTIAAFSILVSFYQKDLFFLILICVIVFIAFCAGIHKKIQQRLRFWMWVHQSYTVSVDRIKRNFSNLKKQVSPWHQHVSMVPAEHPYAFDLDLSNHLFLLLNTCSTKQGSQKLFDLLLSGGVSFESKESRTKRSACAEILRKQSVFLRRYETLRWNEEFDQSRDTQDNQDSIQHHNTKTKSIFQSTYAFLNILIWICLVFPAVFHFLTTGSQDVRNLYQPMLLYAVVAFFNVVVFQSLVKMSSQFLRDSKVFSEILSFLDWKDPHLTELPFSFLKRSSIRQIQWIKVLLDWISIRGNPVFWIMLHLLVPFDAVMCLLLQWKLKSIQTDFSRWQFELAEFDVAASFARIKHENPEFHFLTKQEQDFSDFNSIQVEDMIHPLLSHEHAVSNSLSLFKNSPLVLLTGSNMSGKSTFLRALATNILLSNIGAPVCANVFFIPQSLIFCAIRIHDSLAEGTSYFYAEVKRLRMILKELESNKGKRSAFFFIDEIFKGTNNKERFVGSWHVIKALLEQDAFGFVSTHDLSLCDLNIKDKRVRNMHFKDHVQKNHLIFDYLIKEGPCPTSNAIRIMQLEGLPVPDDIE